MDPSPWRPLRKSIRPHFTSKSANFSAKSGQLAGRRSRHIGEFRPNRPGQVADLAELVRLLRISARIVPGDAKTVRAASRKGQKCQNSNMAHGRSGQAGQPKPARPGQAGQLGHCRIVGASWANVQMSNSSALKRSPEQHRPVMFESARAGASLVSFGWCDVHGLSHLGGCKDLGF